MKTNSGISLIDLVDCKHARRGQVDDGTFCSKCGSNSEGWCKTKKGWCHKVKGKCDKNILFIEEKIERFKARKSS